MTQISNGGRRLTGLAALVFAAALLAPMVAPFAEPRARAHEGSAPLRLAQATTPDTAANPGGAFTPDQRKAIEAIIKDYLIANPEVFLEVQSALEAKMEEIQAKRLQAAIVEQSQEIYRSPGAPTIGNPSGDITVVEFFDYNCPYCRATYAEMKDYLKTNPDTKVVLKDVASLGEHSEAVARLVIAAAKQKRDFLALHDALMTAKGQMTEPRALSVAQKLGYDIEEMKKIAASQETAETLSRTQDLATALSVNVTPFYIVGHHGVAGAPEDLVPQISKRAEDIRKSGCDVC